MIRKTILTLSFIIISLLLLLQSGLQVFPVNHELKELLLSKVREIGGNDCSVENLSIGIGTVSMEGIKFSFDDAPYELWIDELRLGYSITSLLRDGLISEKTAEEITIYRPVLTLHYQSDPAENSEVDLSLRLSEEAEEKYRSLIKKYDFIKRITISDGEIKLKKYDDATAIRVARNVNGWAYTDDESRAWLRLAGHLFDTDSYNMVMYGQLDLARGGLDYINVDLHDYEVGSSGDVVIPRYVDVEAGVLQGHLKITEKPNFGQGFTIDGNLSLRDGNFQVSSEHLLFEDINIDAEIKDWDLEISEATQKINGAAIELSGRINNIIDPKLDLTVSSQELDVEHFLNQLFPEKKFPFKGKANVRVDIKDDMDNPEVSGYLSSNELVFYKKPIDSLTVRLALDKNLLNFKEISARLDSLHIDGTGTIDFQSKERIVGFDLLMTGALTSQLQRRGFPLVASGRINSKVKVLGSLLNPVSRGSFQMALVGKPASQVDLEGSFQYNRGQFTLHTSASEGLKVDLAVGSVFTNRPTLSFESTNLQQLVRFSGNPILDMVQKRYGLDVQANGYLDSLAVRVGGYRRLNYEKVFQIESLYRAVDDEPRVDSKIALLPNTKDRVDGSFSVTLGADETELTGLKVGDWLTGHFAFSTSNEFDHHGKMNISGMQLSTLLAILGENPIDYSGKVYGQISLQGMCEEPKFVGDLWLHDGFLQSLGPLKAHLVFNADDRKLDVEKLTVLDSEVSVDQANDLAKAQKGDLLSLHAKGSYEFQSQIIDAAIAGVHVKVQDVLNLFTEDKDVVKGDALIQVTIKGPGPNWRLSGNVTVSNPQILMLNFDEIALDFGQAGQGNGSFISKDYLSVGRAIVSKSEEFEMAGPARISLVEGKNPDIQLSGDGNFLAVLPDLTDLFGKSSSRGHLDLKMSGDYTMPDFSGSTLQLSNGEMRLSSVAKKIDNIQANLAIHKNDYFLDIRQLTGQIEGRKFSIANTNVMTGLNHGVYEPLRIAGDDLNLGALIIETGVKGVPLHVPGLMEEGEIGWYRLQGYDVGERFFIAGPWSNPVVRGKVGVRNANVMFPFDESAGEENEVVLNIINNINWNVLAKSEKDTRYVKRFQAGMYVDMEVDKESSWLDFKGILKDSTFNIDGKVESTRGEIEYFDLNFRVEKVGAEFTRPSLDPIVYGKAWTVVRDTVSNVPNDVYLTLITTDNVTKDEVTSGRWDRINVKLSSEYPTFEQTQSELMASLGYSSDTIDEQAKKAVGSSTDNLLLRPLFRPIERQLERRLSLDVVRFSYAIAQNFLDSSFNNGELSSSLAFLRSSRLLLGKYLTEDLYLLYSGQLKAGIGYQFQKKGVGLQHILGLEYRLNSKWLFQMEYDYNTLFETHKDDKKVWLRHSFPF